MKAAKGTTAAEAQTFVHLVEQYQTALLRICYVYLQDRSLAEDAVQETFLKAFKSMRSFRGDCSEKTWLMRIAINTCHDTKRSGWFRHTDRRITPELLPEPEAAPSEEGVQVAVEIMELPPKLREVVLLYYYQNLSVQEIAQALGITHSSVSNRMKRARDKLREAMKGEYFYE